MTIVEGNYKNAVNRRQVDIDGRYIRGFICPRYDIEVKPTDNETLEAVARDVIRGKYGNGSARRKNLENAGYSYAEVQAMVNKLIK